MGWRICPSRPQHFGPISPNSELQEGLDELYIAGGEISVAIEVRWNLLLPIKISIRSLRNTQSPTTALMFHEKTWNESDEIAIIGT
jgi:hypothetical protein